MSRMNKVFVALALFSYGAFPVGAQHYAARITLNSDRSWVTPKVAVKGEYMLAESGKFTVPVASVKQIEFRFERMTLRMCETAFGSGEYKKLLNLLKENIDPVASFSGFSGNLGEYLIWMARGQFWSGDYEGLAQTLELLQKSPDVSYVKTADMYNVMLLIEQKKVADAQLLFDAINAPEEVSVAMAAYIRGRLAFGRYDFKAAIKSFSQILAFYPRDVEWMPAATWMEIQVYLETDQVQKANDVAKELIMAYPSTQWSEMGKKIVLGK